MYTVATIMNKLLSENSFHNTYTYIVCWCQLCLLAYVVVYKNLVLYTASYIATLHILIENTTITELNVYIIIIYFSLIS